MTEITKTASAAMKTLKRDDDDVVWGGANDIGRNNTKETVEYITNFVTDKKEVNIVLIISPQRHGLTPSSCANKEVLKFNRQVNKITKFQPNVKLLELNLVRNHFISHGLHMNLSGKELVSQNLAKIIEQLY